MNSHDCFQGPSAGHQAEATDKASNVSETARPQRHWDKSSTAGSITTTSILVSGLFLGLGAVGGVYYLKKREKDKLSELKEMIEDEQYLFEGVQLTARERAGEAGWPSASGAVGVRKQPP